MFASVTKERLVNVRLKERTHEEFKIACELRGTSPEMIWKTYSHVLPSMRSGAMEKLSAALY